jgi:hypothetical protein
VRALNVQAVINVEAESGSSPPVGRCIPALGDHAVSKLVTVCTLGVIESAPCARTLRDRPGCRIAGEAQACTEERRAAIGEAARRAGVTHGLVMRRFGPKEQLFLAAVPGSRTLREELAGDPRALPVRVARSYARRMAAAGGDAPFVAMLRAVAAGEEATGQLLTAMQDDSLERYRPMVPGHDPGPRAGGTRRLRGRPPR